MAQQPTYKFGQPAQQGKKEAEAPKESNPSQTSISDDGSNKNQPPGAKSVDQNADNWCE